MSAEGMRGSAWRRHGRQCLKKAWEAVLAEGMGGRAWHRWQCLMQAWRRPQGSASGGLKKAWGSQTSEFVSEVSEVVSEVSEASESAIFEGRFEINEDF